MKIIRLVNILSGLCSSEIKATAQYLIAYLKADDDIFKQEQLEHVSEEFKHVVSLSDLISEFEKLNIIDSDTIREFDLGRFKFPVGNSVDFAKDNVNAELDAIIDYIFAIILCKKSKEEFIKICGESGKKLYVKTLKLLIKILFKEFEHYQDMKKQYNRLINKSIED